MNRNFGPRPAGRKGVPTMSQPGEVDFSVSIPSDDGWIVRQSDQIKSRFQEDWVYRQNEMGLWLSDRQIGQRKISGYDLRQELEGKAVMGSQIIEHYRGRDQDLTKNNFYLPLSSFPREWFGLAIFCWGTIFRNWKEGEEGKEELYVRYFYCGDDGLFYVGYRWLGDIGGWSANSPALVYWGPIGS